ncbi:MAG: hypothetical protein HBSIN02_14570 [Bacteroidia bacterium]|nr:MAG: hypothetical protein HBSIN02_14570 [Bacteroidia bacterium]
MKITFGRLMAAVLAAGVFAGVVYAKDPAGKGEKQSLDKTAGTPLYAILNINNLTAWFRSDGQSNHSPQADNGLYFPRGTANVIYQDGVVFGGKAYLDAGFTTPAPNQLVRVGGGTYGVGTRAGYVTGSGASAVAADPNAADVRIYRIRRDYTRLKDENGNYTDDLRRDAAEVNEIPVTEVSDAQMEAVYQQYATDWTAWPTDKGAPFIDRNNNGVYDPPPAFSATFTVDSLISTNADEPGVAGVDPNSPADQVIWTVYNDLNVAQAQGFAGSEPLGLEIQKTVWGYKRSDALGNLYFSRYKIINKGGVDIGGGNKGSFYIDSMYVCQWSDPDLGSFSDDLVGCDSLLSLGFIYNGNAVDGTFRNFGLAPAAGGYDFLAGPVVPSPGDTAIFDLELKPGYRNLGMSSFAYFSAGSPYSDPPNGEASGYASLTGQWYKMLRGYAPLGTINTADIPYAHPPGVPISKFPLSGDPTTRTGFIDGQGTTYSFAPGDRRILLNTGPFQMAPGDTQEIVVGTVVGLGSDRLSSVTVMKFNDRFVQNTYDARFQVPSAPAPPDVRVTELDGQVFLQWGGNTARVAQTENTINQPGSYTFEGYNVYQLPAPNASRAQWVRITTFDLATDPAVILDERVDEASGQVLSLPVQFGTNSGIQREFNFTRDYVRDIDKIYNGQEYYLVVTSYSRSAISGYLPAALESDPIVLTVRPKVPFGMQLNVAFRDTIPATHASGASDGNVYPIVVAPSEITGHTYQVTFDSLSRWTLRNTTTNTVVLSNQSNQNADILSPYAAGMQIRVGGAPNDAKDFLHTANPSGPINPPTYAAFTTFNGWGFPDASGSSAASGGGPATDYGGGRWGVNQGGAATGDYATFVSRVFRNDNFTRFVPYDFEIRFTAAGGLGYMAFSTGSVVPVPFELWNIGINTPNDPSDDYRMIPWIFDEDGNDQFNLMQIDHALSGGDNDPYTDWIYWCNPVDKSPGQSGYLNEFANVAATYDAQYGVTIGPHPEVMARFVLCNVNGGSVSDLTWPANVNSLMPATGNVIRIVSTKPNTPSDVFTFNTSAYAPTNNAASQVAGTDRVGVFPNPYYAFNAAETNRFSRFVTFNNLPPKVTVRIFNLAGQLVRRLDKDDPSQFLRWDLANSANFPVASGMYVAHLELTMPSDGSVVTKVLKLAVIQEQEILNSY